MGWRRGRYVIGSPFRNISGNRPRRRFRRGLPRPAPTGNGWGNNNTYSPVRRGNEGPASQEDVSVKSINLLKERNEVEHHTTEYNLNQLVVRRGQPFFIAVTYSRSLQTDVEPVHLVFSTGDRPQQTKGTLVRVRVSNQTPENRKWGACVETESESEVTYKVVAAADALVGEYSVGVEVQGSSRHLNRRPPKFYLIFNAWCPEDSVYMNDEKERHEYVMNDTGLLYMGNSTQHYARPWNFGQFESVSLPAALYLLKRSPLEKVGHGNPVRVTRVLSAMVNSNSGDGGILVGNWSGDYSGGVSPTAWNGSVAILRKYMRRGGRKVKYGQCWVYSGLITTLSRALGIPTRSVSNFESAHDTDGSLTVDRHIDSRGRPLGDMDDSVWNFHVWNESWFLRPDLPKGHDGWQVYDATPQEESANSMQCGPVPVRAVKDGNVYLPYDGGFVFAEVNGDRLTWEVDDYGDLYPVGGEPHSIGQKISTKAVGSDERNDITNEYKWPEGSKEERQSVARAIQYSSRTEQLKQVYQKEARYDVKTEMDGEVESNGDVRLVFRLRNKTSQERTVRINWNIHAKYNNGLPGDVIKEKEDTVQLSEKQEEEVTWSLRAMDYIPLLHEDASLEVYALASVQQTGQKRAHQKSFAVQKPSLDLRVPSSMIKPGEKFRVTISFTNPLDVSLTNGEMRVEGSGMEGSHTVRFRRAVGPGHTIKQKVKLVARERGKPERFVLASFNSRQLTNVTGTAPVNVAM